MITSFCGNYGFLSNFHPSVILFNDLYFPTVEHAYQASKTLVDGQKLLIRNAPSPGHAKRMGEKIALRPDWQDVKLKTMGELLTIKFDTHPDLMTKLMATGDEMLVEGNNWGDKFWGCVFENDEWVGQNRIGMMLMQLRDIGIII